MLVDEILEQSKIEKEKKSGKPTLDIFPTFLSELKHKRNEKFKDIDKDLLSPDISSDNFLLKNQPFIASQFINLELNDDLENKLRLIELTTADIPKIKLFNEKFFTNILSRISIDSVLENRNGFFTGKANENNKNIFNNKSIAEFAMATKSFCLSRRIPDMNRIDLKVFKNYNNVSTNYTPFSKLFSSQNSENMFYLLSTSPHVPSCISDLNPQKISKISISSDELIKKFDKLFKEFEMDSIEKEVFLSEYLCSLDNKTLLSLINDNIFEKLTKEQNVSIQNIDSIISLSGLDLFQIPFPENSMFKKLDSRKINSLTINEIEKKFPNFVIEFEIIKALADRNMLLTVQIFNNNYFKYNFYDNYSDLRDKYFNLKYPNDSFDFLYHNNLHSINSQFLEDFTLFSIAGDAPLQLMKHLPEDYEKILSEEPDIKTFTESICKTLQEYKLNCKFSEALRFEIEKSREKDIALAALIAVSFPSITKVFPVEIFYGKSISNEIIDKYNKYLLYYGGSFRDCYNPEAN